MVMAETEAFGLPFKDKLPSIISALVSLWNMRTAEPEPNNLATQAKRRSAWQIIEGDPKGIRGGFEGDPGGSGGIRGGQLKITEVSDKRRARNTE